MKYLAFQCGSFSFLLFGLSLGLCAQEPSIELQYALSPDSFVQDGVPQGTVTDYVWKDSQVFPGTIRRYSVYLPAKYDADQPLDLMVFQDGHAYLRKDGHFRVPTVLDNLIHQGDLPPMVGIFVDPGHLQENLPAERGWDPTPENRSFEYDSLSPDYSEFLIREIIPEVSKQVKITDDPERRAICGISSGGICAFTVAWERPDQFRKVLSHIGSFVNIRGGHVYPALIRKQPKRPIKVFLQAGSQDLDNEHGNWPLGNQQMAAALEFRDYEYEFIYGEGAHNGNHGGAILPQALRWLWSDDSSE